MRKASVALINFNRERKTFTIFLRAYKIKHETSNTLKLVKMIVVSRFMILNAGLCTIVLHYRRLNSMTHQVAQAHLTLIACHIDTFYKINISYLLLHIFENYY